MTSTSHAEINPATPPLNGYAGEHTTCAHKSGKIRAALARTEEQIAALHGVQRRLRGVLGRCERGECTLLSQVSKVTRNPWGMRR